MQTNQFARAVSSILRIVERYMDQRMNEAVKVAIQIQCDRLRDEAQAKNEEFLKNLEANIQKIIKEQVKELVKTSYAVAADLSEMELKKILIEKMESNKTIDMTIDQQVALDKAPVPHASRLIIRKRNFRLRSDITSKESTLQLVYDVLRMTPFYKAFLVTTDVPEIYMEMMHICLRLPGQTFDELPFEEEILAFLRFLRHSKEIRKLTDVNINKLHQPWGSFAAVINKCLSRKITGYDSLQLSQAQILWGMYHKKNVDFAYLLWEDFVYQLEHKDAKKSNEIYYPRITKVIIHYFMTKDPSIPRRNKVNWHYPSIPRRNKINWHYVRDDILFSTIKVVSRHQTTQQYGVILPIELTTDDIRNSKAYKEYYACATGEAVPKPKASARKNKGGSASSTPPPTPIATPTPTTTVVAAPRLSTIAKVKQPARATTPTEPTDVERTEVKQLKIVLKRSRQETQISQQRGSGTDEGTGFKPGVPDVSSDDSEEELSWNSFDDEDVDEQTKGREESEGDKTNESDDGSDNGNDDDNDETVKAGSERDEDDDDNDDEEELAKNDEEDQDLRLSEEARIQEEEEADELYRDVNINQGRGLQLTQNIEDSYVTLTLVNPDGLQESLLVSSFMTSMLNPISDAGVESIFTTASSPIVSLQTPTPIMTLSTIVTITTSSDAPIPPTTIPSTIPENLPTFNSVFRFDERLRSLETTFSKYRQTNPFVDAVSTILDIVHQYMTQQMMEADDDDHQDDDDQDEGNDDDQDTDDEGDEFIHLKSTIHEEEETKDEESFDPIVQTPENSDDEGNDDANLGLNVGSEEGQDAEDDEDELYRDVNINLEGRDVQMTDVHTTQEFEDTHVTLTPVNPDGEQ
nr:hypothetical protein [Tanacetum cinerariifolium]